MRAATLSSPPDWSRGKGRRGRGHRAGVDQSASANGVLRASRVPAANGESTTAVLRVQRSGKCDTDQSQRGVRAAEKKYLKKNKLFYEVPWGFTGFSWTFLVVFFFFFGPKKKEPRTRQTRAVCCCLRWSHSSSEEFKLGKKNSKKNYEMYFQLGLSYVT